MDNGFYKNARKWYNTLYVEPACERMVYFIIMILSISCLFLSFSAIKTVKKIKEYKNTYILLVNKKDQDSFMNIKQIDYNKNSTLAILDVMIRKYVLNMESLRYDKNKTGIDAIRKKSIIIKNLSGPEVYNKYMESTYKDENGDMSLSILKLQKIATIHKIEFIYEDINIFEKIYSQILIDNIPKGAKIYFSTETTDEKQRKQNFIATMSFNFFIDNEAKINSNIDFKVNDYYVEKDNTVLNINNEDK